MSPENVCSAVVYIAEAVTAWIYFEYLFDPKKKAKTRLIALTVIYLVLWFVFLLDDFFVNATLFFIGNLFVLFTCYCTGKTSAMLHAAFMTFVMIFTEVIIMMLLISLFGDFGAFTYNLMAQIVASVLSKILYFFVILIFSRIYGPKRRTKEEPYFVLLICLLPAASMVISVMIMYVGVTTSLTNRTEFLMMVSIFLLLFVNLAVLAVNNQIQKINYDRTTLQLSIQKEQADTNYYQMLQTQYDNQRMLIHDIKNQFRVIEGLAREGKNEELIDYIYRSETKPEFSNQIRWCDNTVLNAILIWYSEQCKQYGVIFNCDVRADCVSFMDSNSITALFGNLLSNAFEAAVASQDKILEVFIKRDNINGVAIFVSNTCDTEPKQDRNGYFISSKRDARNHGIGMKSIARVVKRYGGLSSTRYDNEEKRFHSIIHFPQDRTIF